MKGSWNEGAWGKGVMVWFVAEGVRIETCIVRIAAESTISKVNEPSIVLAYCIEFLVLEVLPYSVFLSASSPSLVGFCCHWM